MKRIARLTTATIFSFGLCAMAHADIVACNDFRAPIRMALAYERAGGIASAGRAVQRS